MSTQKKARQCGYKLCSGLLGKKKCLICKKGMTCQKCGRCRYCSGDFAIV